MVREFLGEVKQKVKAVDILLIGSVPVALSFVFLLPEQTQTGLILDYSNPTVFNLWSSAFVHRGFDHLAGNLSSYVLLIIPTYLLAVLSGERRTFVYTFLGFLFVLPFIISLINLVVISPGTGVGFSGIGSAFFGFLPVTLFLFLRNRISEDISVSNAVVLFLIAAASIALTYTGISTLTLGVVAVTILLILYDAYLIGGEELKAAATELAQSEGYFALVLLSTLLFLFSPMVLFPADLARSETTVNILSHYTGLSLGFFLPYIALFYRNWKTNED